MDAGVQASYIGGVSRLGDVRRFLQYLSCLRILTLRALKVRYRRSVLGFLWSLLYPLSAMVQAMRKTTQTSLHLESLGPFFVGRTLWQSEPPSPRAEGPD